MKTMCVAKWVFALFTIAGCAVDPDEPLDTSTEEQSLGAGCTLLRPVFWDAPGVQCVEWASSPLSMTDGQVYVTSSRGGFNDRGQIAIRCTDGQISVDWESCIPGGIEP